MAQVTTAHTAAGAEQLNLAPGQLILILTKNHSGWWLGELQVSEQFMLKYLKWAITVLGILLNTFSVYSIIWPILFIIYIDYDILVYFSY